MKIATVAVKSISEEMASETRKRTRTFVRVVPLEIESSATEASFIPLSQEIPLNYGDHLVSILPVQIEMGLFKDIRTAKLEAAQKFHFVQRKFSTCAVVELPAGNIRSEDKYLQPQPYGSQVALIPLWDEMELPQGATLAGVIECEGYVVSAKDAETGQTYRLGYRFEGPGEVNWLGLAQTRRKHWKRSEKDDFEPQPKQYSSIYFASDDKQVIARVTQKFGKGNGLPNGKISFNLRSQEEFEQCQQIEHELVTLRQAAIVNRDLAAQEALRP